MNHYDQSVSEAAVRCAAHTSPAYPTGTPFGAYIRSKYFSGGFNFETFDEAFEWATQLSVRAVRKGDSRDFHAAIATREGHTIAVW